MADRVLKGIIDKITSNTGSLSKTLRYIDRYKLLNLTGLTSPAKSLVISYIINNINRPALIIASDITKALRQSIDIQILTNEKVEFLPSQEASPYELVYSDSVVLKQQLNLLRSFRKGNLKALIAPAKSLLNKYLPDSEYEKHSIKLQLNNIYESVELARKLVNLGYRRTVMVTDPGEFSLRGDILDIFPISEEPVRIEFWGDEVESIRNFDIESQRSTGKINEITIEPRYKIIISEDNKQDFIDKISEIHKKHEENLSDYHRDTLNLNVKNLITSYEIETYFEGVEYFSPLLNRSLEDITDFLPENTLIIYLESPEIEQKIYLQNEKYSNEYKKNVEEGIALPLPGLLHIENIDKKLNKYSRLNLDSFIQDDDQLTEGIECTIVPKFLANLDNAANYISDLRTEGNTVFIVTEYPQRIADVLSEWECPSVYLEEDDGVIASEVKQSQDLAITTSAQPLSSPLPRDDAAIIETKDVIISKSGFSEGFFLPDLKFAVITDTELFNRKLKKPTLAKRVSKKENLDFLVSVNDLNPGDFIVHSIHGIGKFTGMSKQNLDGNEKDYLTIEYANADKLYMPAEQINLISRYRGSGTATHKLSKMGGADWVGTKKKVKNAISDIAQDLLNLYVKRAKTTGYIYDADTPWQIEMEDAFPYTETPDQLQAIIDSKSDMESEKPMDRLICGDVGFGKTEVALRAVFKALLSGKQVAVVAPTTILAQQHYSVFSDRFKPYPVKVELLSRFRTPKQQKETVKRLITGDCDLIIGTHRLLQKDIQFKDLGLVVIDEEHRFGVSHKEKLKQLRAEVDVLTLSATPIPRTLYMALSGVRDMSLINTPPVNRAPIKTYIGQYNESLVRTAIQHEIEREGQIYFVHNRVQSIYKVANQLQELIPDARIAVGHGQMNEKELEKVMYEFSTGQYDILVCTTIIESGLDIPNVNTIIIDDADKFGLAQLYQLRGRVGRSETQAYAYCLYRQDKVLTKEAADRLKAIKDFTTLGSGYQIALRDLEIRGVGNILGAQQHGHMLTVGFDMYCSLLDESVRELQGEKVERKDSPIIDINVTAYIPDEWVGDREQKMIEYKRLADVASLRELDIIEEEWKDRFGKIPDPVKPLIKVIKLRLIASEIGINLVREAGDVTRIFAEYDLAEWKKYQATLPPKILSRLRWTKAPVSSTNAKSIILLNNYVLNGEEQLNMLEDLFYYISVTQNQN